MSFTLNAPPAYQGDIAITCNGQTIDTWMSIRLTRSLRKFSDFEVSVTEAYPNSDRYLILAPFQPITVSIGGTQVLSGYVDRYISSIAPGSHSVTITGRSKCEDLQDCSANQGPLANVQLLDFATKLCSPYGISVTLQGSPKNFPLLGANLTQTPKELIQKVAQYSNLIMYDDVNGNLVLSTVGNGTMGSGLVEEVNIQSGSVELTGDRRFQTYISVSETVSQRIVLLNASVVNGEATDADVPRPRLKIFQTDNNSINPEFAKNLAQWQCNHNIGESQEITVVVDSWRDVNGKLWEPNWYCAVNSPSLKVVNGGSNSWVIADVTYRRDTSSGTVAELRLSPASAFIPEPVMPIGNREQIIAGSPGAAPATFPPSNSSNPANSSPPTISNLNSSTGSPVT